MDVAVSGRILYEDGFKYLGLWTFVAFCLREASLCAAFGRRLGRDQAP